MGSADHLLQVNKRISSRRLLFKNIECSSCHLPRLNGVVKVFLVDDSPTGAVDQDHSVFHLAKDILIDEISGIIGQWRVDADKVRPGQKFIKSD